MSNKEALLYLQIARSLEIQIRDGLLKPGEKMPSVRQASKRKDVSVNTVVKAYFELEKKQLIEPRPQSGYYVSFTGGRGYPCDKTGFYLSFKFYSPLGVTKLNSSVDTTPFIAIV